MIRKIYSEWYDQETGQVYSHTEIRFLGILIYLFKTSTNSWSVISGYTSPQEGESELYKHTKIGFEPDNEQET